MGARFSKPRLISTRGIAAAGLLLDGTSKILSGVQTSPPKGSGVQAAQLGRAAKPVKANEIAVKPLLSNWLKILFWPTG